MAFLKNIWKNNSKHHKLSEELALQNAKETLTGSSETIDVQNDVATFKLKYLGSTVVEKITGERISVEAVKSIVKVAKASRKKLQRVNVTISLKGICVTDLLGNDILKVSIYRISNCSTDPTHRHIFSFISTDSNETMECHAFFCSKRKLAETVTLAVAHSFSTAYEAWRVLPSTQEFQKNLLNEVSSNENNRNQINKNDERERCDNVDIEAKLIDFDDPCPQSDLILEGFTEKNAPSNQNSQWVCFDDDFAREIPSQKMIHNQNDLIFA